MRFVFICAVLIISSHFIQAQGCSDAGFCTMGAMKPDQPYSDKIDIKLRSVEINAYVGKTTLSPVIYILTADATISITNTISFQAKIPYQAVRGNFGNTEGVGDLSFSLTKALFSNKKGSLNATIGTKIPTNDSKKSDPEKWGVEEDLPMYYQTSLGSYDVVLGVSWINDKWLVATGIQVALTENKNDFKWGDWIGNYTPSDNAEGNERYVRSYDLANNLKRGTDVMLRIERNFRFTNYNLNIGVLPIYRITHDERYDFTQNKRIKENGTTGLALTGLIGGGYNFNVNSGVKLLIGYKFTDRDTNPDGLTRDYVSSVSYIYRF